MPLSKSSGAGGNAVAVTRCFSAMLVLQGQILLAGFRRGSSGLRHVASFLFGRKADAEVTGRILRR